MRRERKKDYKASKGAGKLASDTVEKNPPGGYGSRYVGELAPEKKVVEGPRVCTYNSRYK